MDFCHNKDYFSPSGDLAWSQQVREKSGISGGRCRFLLVLGKLSKLSSCSNFELRHTPEWLAVEVLEPKSKIKELCFSSASWSLSGFFLIFSWLFSSRTFSFLKKKCTNVNCVWALWGLRYFLVVLYSGRSATSRRNVQRPKHKGSWNRSALLVEELDQRRRVWRHRVFCRVRQTQSRSLAEVSSEDRWRRLCTVQGDFEKMATSSRCSARPVRLGENGDRGVWQKGIWRFVKSPLTFFVLLNISTSFC